MNKNQSMSSRTIYLTCVTLVCLALLPSSVARPLPPADPYTLVHSFRGGPSGDAETPIAGLTLVGATLYGTSIGGPPGTSGTVFRVNTDGTGYGLLHSFAPSGGRPAARLTPLGSKLFGTTDSGATHRGTIFTINADGSGFESLHEFDGTDGALVTSSLTLVGDKLFGTASLGGESNDGTIFRINQDGTDFSVLRSMQSTEQTWYPAAGLSYDGSKFYGTAQFGGEGVDASGAVYSVQSDGSDFSHLHTFTFTDNGTDGIVPRYDLLLVGDTLYGTTLGGGTSFRGTIFRINTDGTGYQTLYSFLPTDGWYPQGGLTLVGSTLFGTTSYGGANENGIVYRINTDGTGFGVIHNFAGGSDDGTTPYGELVFDGARLYGTTAYGGAHGAGTVFAIAIPEPTSWQLAAIGLCGLLLVGGRFPD